MTSAIAAAAQSATTGTIDLPTIEVGTKAPAKDSLTPLGARLPEPVTPHPVTQSISVVERGQIEQTSPTGLLDILSSVPGISVARAGGNNGQVYLRGFSSNDFRVPMYIDGDRFRGRNTLQTNYISPEEIERVEVIRGPASVLYGSEALSGLINVITRSPTGNPNGPFRFTGGGWSAGYGSAANSFTTYDWIQGAGGGFDFLGSVSHRQGDDYKTPFGTVSNSDYKSLGGTFKLGYTPTLGQRLEFTYRAITESGGRGGGVGGGGGAPYGYTRQDPNEVQTGRLFYSGEFDGAVKHVEASIYANYYNTTQPAIVNTLNASGVATRTVTTTSHVIGPLVVGGRALGVIPLSGWFGETKTTFGADTFKEMRPGSEQFSQTVNRNAAGAVTSVTNVGNFKTGPDTTQTNVGAFVLHEWTPVKPLTISAGGRFDWFNTTSDTGPNIPAAVLPAFLGRTDVNDTAPTGSLGAVYRVIPALDLLASVGTSFREPTNSQLYAFGATPAPGTIPNPGLQPEKGVTYETGFVVHADNATIKVTGYKSYYENFLQNTIVTFNGVPGYTQSQNVGDAETQGLEAEARWQVTPTTNIFGSVASIRGTNTTTGQPLPYLAPWRGRGGVQYVSSDGGYSVEGVVNWAAEKSRIDPTQEIGTAAYAVPNVYATFHLGKLVAPSLGDTKLIIGVENILNAGYRDASTFVSLTVPQSYQNPLVEMGRNVTVKLQHTF